LPIATGVRHPLSVAIRLHEEGLQRPGDQSGAIISSTRGAVALAVFVQTSEVK
jgi:hypothetical protein